ncbi:proline dehydrogenase family protein, partial [Streptomyces pseudovenezuelae]|uniref:proline dehydrogenase family protein n=2 Tax=Streptomyces TaxID=1883 RepID=UPI0034A172EF
MKRVRLLPAVALLALSPLALAACGSGDSSSTSNSGTSGGQNCQAPTGNASGMPSGAPSGAPTGNASTRPSGAPSGNPSGMPSGMPSGGPGGQGGPGGGMGGCGGPGGGRAPGGGGLGQLALHLLAHRLPPTPTLKKSIEELCQVAHDRHVRVLFDGEEDALQRGIDDWSIDFSRAFNTHAGGATIFGTYQSYKKSTAEVLTYHLAEAQKDGFTLGVKLVRGAYLETDPRELIHETKEATDACYDETAEALLKRQWTEQIKGSGEFPDVSLMLATHNSKS